jgi:PAS domain S-box-containing protein
MEPRQFPPSDELLRLLFESARDYAIFSTDRAGLVTSWNSGAERVLGYKTEEIVGKTADVIFTPEDRSVGAPDREREDALVGGRAEDNRWQMRKNGQRFWASGMMMPLDGHLGFVKILRDDTSRHEAEIARDDIEERFRLLATNIPQLVFRSLGDGNRTWPSPQWIEFTGLNRENSLGLGWLDAIHPDDRDLTRAAWQTAQNTNEYFVEHRVFRRQDGKYRWHQTRARPIGGISAANADWVGTMTDIHDLRTFSDRQTVLIAELQHRTRNLLAVTQAIASQTLPRNAARVEFESRLRSLAQAQVLISQRDDGEVDLAELLTAELNAHSPTGLKSGKITVHGPKVALPPLSTQALGLALHELATNAVKHGALKRREGKLEVVWRVEQSDQSPTAVLEWKESDVVLPASDTRRPGYGTHLIQRALPYQLDAATELTFEEHGIRCLIKVPLASEER